MANKYAPEKTLQLTALETQVLEAYPKSDFHDGKDPFVEGAYVWTFSVEDASGVPSAQFKGVISSLIKKGLMWVQDYDSDTICGLTHEGRAYFSRS